MGWLFWFLVLLAILAAVQSRYYRKHAMSHLTYTRTLSQTTAQAGDTVVLEEEVFNDKLIPLPWLRAEYQFPAWLQMGSSEDVTHVDDRLHRSVFQPGCYSRITRQHTLTCLRRGVYDLGRVSLSAGDLLGLSMAYRNDAEEVQLTVYPKRLSLADLPETAQQWQGEVGTRRWIFPDPILVSGLRSYQPGDNRRDVHWRASARSGELQVKIHDYTVQPRVLVVLNITPFHGFWGAFSHKQTEQLEKAISMAATILTWAWERGMEVGFVTNGDECEDFIPPMRTAGQLDRTLLALAKLRIRERTSAAHMLETILTQDVRRTDILVLSPWWSNDLEQTARALRRRENAVTRLDWPEGGDDLGKATAS
jgi:uncharacterized protein (DUF58 family)